MYMPSICICYCVYVCACYWGAVGCRTLPCDLQAMPMKVLCLAPLTRHLALDDAANESRQQNCHSSRSPFYLSMQHKNIYQGCDICLLLLGMICHQFYTIFFSFIDFSKYFLVYFSEGLTFSFIVRRKPYVITLNT